MASLQLDLPVPAGLPSTPERRSFTTHALTEGLPSPPATPDELRFPRTSGPTAHPPTVAIIGTGYVGKHLVGAFNRHYPVIAYDIKSESLPSALKTGTRYQLTTTTDPEILSQASIFLVSVPTVLQADLQSINTEPLETAVETLRMYAPPKSTVVVESSVAVGMTRSLFCSLTEEPYDMLVGMSPERVDPGRQIPAFESIPKIVSGLNHLALKSIIQIYSTVFEKVVPVSQPEVAEMTKLYENCQRMMCITLANEMADACYEIGIHHGEISKAAATKPFGYLPVTASPGIGGHCIPVNPWYLVSTSKSWPTLEFATRRSKLRPARLAQRLLENVSFQNPRILVVGFGFKPGQSLTTNSPGVDFALALYDLLSVRGRLFDIQYYDPLVPHGTAHGHIKRWTDWRKSSLECCFDVIAVLMRQDGIDWGVLERCDPDKVNIIYEC